MRAVLVGAAAWVVLVATGIAEAHEVDKAKVRQAIHLPTMGFPFGVYFNSDRGFYWDGDKDDILDLIRAAQKSVGANPSDPSSHAELARLYDRAEQKDESRAEWKRTEDACRSHLREHPDDPALLCQLGEALDWKRPETEVEAEAALRKVLAIDPKNGRGWQILGALLSARAIRLEGSGTEPPPPWSPEIGRRAEALFRTAEECYDRAIKVTPTRADLYMCRAVLRGCRAARNAQSTATETHMSDTDAGPMISDLWTVARLEPDDPRAVVTAAWLTLSFGRKGSINSRELVPSLKDRLKALPEQHRTQIEKGVQRLKELGHSEDRRKASTALTLLGFFQQMALEDGKAAEISLRRAVALDPTRETAWDGLMGCLLESSRSEELLTVARERLKQRKSPRNHLLLAKAYQKVGRTGEAEGELRSALRLDPKDVNANLGVAVLALKRGVTTSDPGFAKPFIAALDNLGAADQEARRNFAVLDAARHALEGDAAEAKQLLRIVLETDHGHSGALSLLSALEP
jgi:tetratricopeptide (TPR) repeat protein